jgi:RNA 2'-phosphotransferase, Tpt1 / KptA family
VPDVELNLEWVAPPKELCHGTVAAFLVNIREHGLLNRSRNHVHLSAEIETAKKVGTRWGKPILTIQSDAKRQSGDTLTEDIAEFCPDIVQQGFDNYPGYVELEDQFSAEAIAEMRELWKARI